MLKTNFMSTTKFRGHKKIWGVNAPVFAGLGRTFARKFSIGGLNICAGGLDILKIYI